MSIVRIAALACVAVAAAGSAAAQGADKCAALAGTVIAKAQIGIPSGDAKIASAEAAAIAATMAAPEPTVSYCKVLGAIAPIDPAATPIQFQINLPAQWNARAVQYGGGGYNGVLITGLAPLRDSPPDLTPPLARGFMTYGTDSGHDGAKLPEIMAFALNDEALENFAHASYKKVRDVAVALAKTYYARAPEKIYFFGGSEGGREGLTMAQRYPADFDGIVSVVPVINWVGLQFSGTRTGLAQRDGGWISPAKVKVIHQAVLAACDKADGLADGIISRPDACLKSFDAKTLRCPDGKDSGETCLSDAQLKVAETIRMRFEFPTRSLTASRPTPPGTGAARISPTAWWRGRRGRRRRCSRCSRRANRRATGTTAPVPCVTSSRATPTRIRATSPPPPTRNRRRRFPR